MVKTTVTGRNILRFIGTKGKSWHFKGTEGFFSQLVIKDFDGHKGFGQVPFI